MQNKVIKLFQTTLLGALFLAIPLVSHAARPNVSTDSPTNLKMTSVTLRGTVDTNSRETDVWFEYGTNSRLNNSTSTDSHYIGSSGRDRAWTMNLSGLSANTTYYFRAVAENRDGTRYGSIRSFTTNRGSSVNQRVSSGPSSVRTEPASSIGGTSVQLNSLVTNPGNDFSRTWFEWGTTVSLGYKTDAMSTGTLPAARHAHTITGLAPGTTYYFRAVAENSSVKNMGVVLSFTTSGAQRSVQAYTYTGGTSGTSTITPVEKDDRNETKREESALTASVIGAGSFIPSSLLGWLVLLILVLLLVILAKHLHRNLIGKQPEHTREHA